MLRSELAQARVDRQQTHEQMGAANRVLADQLAAVHSKLPHANMKAIGAVGEDHVSRVITETLEACELTPLDEHGDVHVRTPGGMLALVEVKNVCPIQSERDVGKFHRDRQRHLENGGNAAMFVSLRASIPNFKSGLRFEFDSSGLRIPVMYVDARSEGVRIAP